MDDLYPPAQGPAHIAEDVRLYGLPHAEHMYLDVASLWEVEIDGYDEEDRPQDEGGGWIVEEWDVEDPLNLMPQADWLLDYMEERLCEEHTHDNDDCGFIFKSPAVVAAAEELRRVIASKVTWHQARKKLADHRITMMGDQPFLDGEPLYRPISLDGRPADE